MIGFALVAAAVYFSRDVGPAQAAAGSPNYSIVDARDTENLTFAAWVLNNVTGEVRFCGAVPGSKGGGWNAKCFAWVGR